MKTNKVKVCELTGAALDWAVASIECDEGWLARHLHLLHTMSYSTDWSQGGPIVDRLFVEFGVSRADPILYAAKLYVDDKRHIMHGPTHLIAAMRCYVASKLGDEVDVPPALI